jgi:hypothetical protein
MTAPRATHGFLNVLELVPTVAWVVMSVGLGTLSGSLISTGISPIVAAVMPYFIYMWAVYSDVYIDRTLFGDLLVFDDSSRDYLRVPVELLAFRSILWIALGVALIGWILKANRAAFRAAIVAAFALAGALVVAGVRVPAPNEYAATCLGSAPRVCVDRAHDHLEKQYRDLIVSALPPLQGLGISEATFVQSRGLFAESTRYAGTSGGADGMQIVIPLAKRNTEPAHQIDGNHFPAYFGSAIFLSPCQQLGDASEQPSLVNPGRDAAIVLYGWWLTQSGLPSDGSNYPGELAPQFSLSENASLAAALKKFSSLSNTERSAWFAERRNQIFSCTASLDQ